MINISINTHTGQQGNTVQYPVQTVSLSSHTVKGEKVTWLNKILSSNLEVNLTHPQVLCSHSSDLSWLASKQFALKWELVIQSSLN